MSETEHNFTVDFIGIGGQRCGTTWLSRCLRDHPEVCLSRDKETHYFTLNHHKGEEWYRSQFGHCTNEKVKGEFCTDYFESLETAERIKQRFPDVKIIVSLRNPADRSFSHYLYRKRKSGKPRGFDEVLEQDHKKIIENSKYGKYVVPFLQMFPEENVLVLIHDEYKQDPLAHVQKLYRFLGVDNTFVPDSLYAEVNRSKNLRYRFDFIEKLASYRMTFTSSAIGKVVTPWLHFFRINKLFVYIRGINKIRGDHEETEVLNPTQRKRVMTMLQDDIAELENYIGRKLTIWSNGEG